MTATLCPFEGDGAVLEGRHTRPTLAGVRCIFFLRLHCGCTLGVPQADQAVTLHKTVAQVYGACGQVTGWGQLADDSGGFRPSLGRLRKGPEAL